MGANSFDCVRLDMQLKVSSSLINNSSQGFSSPLVVFCSLIVKTLSRCLLLCFRGSSCERGSWELIVMMAQLLQILERSWLSPRSGEEHSADLCVPSHVSRVSAAGPGTGSSSSLVRRLLGKLGLVWVSQQNKS